MSLIDTWRAQRRQPAQPYQFAAARRQVKQAPAEWPWNYRQRLSPAFSNPEMSLKLRIDSNAE
jgi:hypothetical protein